MVMVMETPSPQNVGLQFVRQYYTLLNQAPEHLHRFYNVNSSFVHGGMDGPGKPATPVFGQQEIHKKILQLDFRDCHAKIRLVDSQATLGDGVVVQVTGELSNNGQPMRRFMQTFVLALQSPKKYYVHNDILRYQDEVFPEDDDNDVQEGSVQAESEDDRAEVSETPGSLQDSSIQHYYSQRPVNNGTAHVDEPSVQQPVSTVNAMPVVAHNTMGPPAALSPVTNPPIVAPHVAPTVPSPSTVQQPSEPDIPLNNDVDKQDLGFQEEDDYQEKVSDKSPEPVEEISEPAADEPKTYATMLSKNTSNTFAGSCPVAAPNSIMGSGKASSNIHNTPPTTRSETKNDNNFMQPQPQRQPRPKGNSMRGGTSNNYYNNSYSVSRDRMINRGNSDEANDGDRRRSTSQYPDNQQLFVGNLPHEVDENVLRDLFGEFGHVVDLRINNKPQVKPGGIGKVPPIYYQGDHRLNVEEKKMKTPPRISGNNDMRPGSGRPGLSRGGSLVGGRGGNRGGGMGMNRGGEGGGRGGGSRPFNANRR